MGAGGNAYLGGLNMEHTSGYLQQIRRLPMLEPEEERTLAKAWREQGDTAAADKLVTSHLRLVAHMAMRYRGYGLPIGDLISEGNIGLLQALKRFDPDRGFRLSTYARFWIRASIQEYILRSWSLVRIGSRPSDKKLFFNLRRLKGELQAIEEGDMAAENVQTIADRLQVPEPDVIAMNRRLTGQDRSLNAPMRTESVSEWQDWLVDEQASQEALLADRQERSKRQKLISAAMTSLTDRERRILTARRLADDPTTLADLGHAWGISRERVRQIELRALEKLRKGVRVAQVDSRTMAGSSPSFSA